MEFALALLFMLCAVLIAFQAHERSEWREERGELLQRIQAPERASVAYARTQEGEPEPIPPIALDDDQAYEKLRLEREGAVPD